MPSVRIYCQDLKMQLEEIYQKILAKEGRLKRYCDSGKQHNQNRTFQNNEKKFYQQVWGEYTKTNKLLNAKEAKQFRSNIWKQKEHYSEGELIKKNMEKELEIREESPEADMHLKSLRATLQKYRIG